VELVATGKTACSMVPLDPVRAGVGFAAAVPTSASYATRLWLAPPARTACSLGDRCRSP